ncbi:hypothetical protein B0H13DRAFT_1892180 [Mycena leptocephala]|nr:hypothetical protein B0H13DRAFT_1892180 [Mycena leptocephala]
MACRVANYRAVKSRQQLVDSARLFIGSAPSASGAKPSRGNAKPGLWICRFCMVLNKSSAHKYAHGGRHEALSASVSSNALRGAPGSSALASVTDLPLAVQEHSLFYFLVFALSFSRRPSELLEHSTMRKTAKALKTSKGTCPQTRPFETRQPPPRATPRARPLREPQPRLRCRHAALARCRKPQRQQPHTRLHVAADRRPDRRRRRHHRPLHAALPLPEDLLTRPRAALVGVAGELNARLPAALHISVARTPSDAVIRNEFVVGPRAERERERKAKLQSAPAHAPGRGSASEVDVEEEMDRTSPLACRGSRRMFQIYGSPGTAWLERLAEEEEKGEDRPTKHPADGDSMNVDAVGATPTPTPTPIRPRAHVLGRRSEHGSASPSPTPRARVLRSHNTMLPAEIGGDRIHQQREAARVAQAGEHRG